MFLFVFTEFPYSELRQFCELLAGFKGVYLKFILCHDYKSDVAFRVFLGKKVIWVRNKWLKGP